MKCPVCDSEEIKVVGVSKTSDGRRRRYQCANCHRFSTVEVIDRWSIDSLDEYEQDEEIEDRGLT